MSFGENMEGDMVEFKAASARLNVVTGVSKASGEMLQGGDDKENDIVLPPGLKYSN